MDYRRLTPTVISPERPLLRIETHFVAKLRYGLNVKEKQLIIRVLPAIVLFALTGCQPQTPEERLEQAGDALADSEETLESVQRSIADNEEQLIRLKKQRRQLQNRVLTLEERVAKRATDVALFRSVQSGLLEAEELSQSAIAVDAEDGKIRLSGLVGSEAEEAAAVRIARAVPGVESVQSRIEIEAPDSSGN